MSPEISKSIYVSLFVLLLALLMVGNSVVWKLTNLLFTLIALISGCVSSLFLIVFIINNNEAELTNQIEETTENTSYLEKLQLCVLYLKNKLIKSETVTFFEKQVKAKQFTIYEKIHNLGLSDTSCYMKTVYDKNKYSEEACMSKELTQLLNRLFDYSYRDFVEIWYAQVSYDEGKFHKMLCNDYWQMVASISKRLQNVDFLHLIMCKYTRVLTEYFTELRTTACMPRSNEEKPDFQLHWCMTNLSTERDFLRKVSDYVITLTLPLSSLKITSTRLILREIFTNLVLEKTITLLSDPNFINENLLWLLDEQTLSEPDKAYSYAETYEDFIKIINKCDDLNTLYQIRTRICTEIFQARTISNLKKNTSKEGKAKSMDKGELLINRDLKRYLNQCNVAKLQCEKKIKEKIGKDLPSNNTIVNEESENDNVHENQLLSFEEIMRSPVARSYFLKYLRKINKFQLLKFWEQIEFIRNNTVEGKDMARIVSHCYQTYIHRASAASMQINIEKSVLSGMQECVIGNKDARDFYKVQLQVYEKLRSDHYPSFVVSDVYVENLSDFNTLNDDLNIFDSENLENSDEVNGNYKKTIFDGLIKQIKEIDGKLEYKAQALASLRPTSKYQPKMMKRLVREITALQQNKSRLQLRVERYNLWWKNLNDWSIIISEPYFNSNQVTSGSATNFHYCITIRLSDDSDVKGDEVTGWSVQRTLKDFQNFHESLKKHSKWVNEFTLPKPPMFRLLGSQKFLSESRRELDIFMLKVMKDSSLRHNELVFVFLSPEFNDNNFDNNNQSQEGIFKAGVSFSDFFKWLPLEALGSQADDDSESDEEEDVNMDSVASQAYVLISEVFELTGVFRFIRHSLITFVRVAFGRSIDRQLRDTCQWLTCQKMVCSYISKFLDIMWPAKDNIVQPQQKNKQEIEETKQKLKLKILENIPENMSTMIGVQNCKRGFLKLFYAFQDRQLNKHLLFKLLEETLESVFPEIVKIKSKEK